MFVTHFPWHVEQRSICMEPARTQRSLMNSARCYWNTRIDFPFPKPIWPLVNSLQFVGLICIVSIPLCCTALARLQETYFSACRHLSRSRKSMSRQGRTFHIHTQNRYFQHVSKNWKSNCHKMRSYVEIKSTIPTAASAAPVLLCTVAAALLVKLHVFFTSSINLDFSEWLLFLFVIYTFISILIKLSVLCTVVVRGL